MPELVLVDGNRCPTLHCQSYAVVKGDQLVDCISAASIIAKLARDQMMVDLHHRHPGYGFDRHKGYPTPQHRAALQSLGVLPEHRRSYAPVRDALALTRTGSHTQVQTQTSTTGVSPVADVTPAAGIDSANTVASNVASKVASKVAKKTASKTTGEPV